MAKHLEAKLTVEKTFITVGGPDAMLPFNQPRRTQSEPSLRPSESEEPSMDLETLEPKEKPFSDFKEQPKHAATESPPKCPDFSFRNYGNLPRKICRQTPQLPNCCFDKKILSSCEQNCVSNIQRVGGVFLFLSRHRRSQH